MAWLWKNAIRHCPLSSEVKRVSNGCPPTKWSILIESGSIFRPNIRRRRRLPQDWKPPRNGAMRRKRIDAQFPTDLCLESGEGASDIRPLIGQEIGAVEFARLHPIDEIPRDRQRLFRDTTRSRKRVSDAGRNDDGQDQGISELPDTPLFLIKHRYLADRKAGRLSRFADWFTPPNCSWSWLTPKR